MTTPDPATVEDVRARFPVFDDSDTYPQQRIAVALADAALMMGKPRRWRERYAIGQSYLAAHLLAVQGLSEQQGGAAAGPLQSINVVGEISVAYSTLAGGSTADDPLFRTTYGQEYVRLRRLVASFLGGVAP